MRFTSADQVSGALCSELGERPEVFELFAELMQQREYDEAFCLKLCDIAEGERADAWDVRCLATLMLHHQLLHLSADNAAAFRPLLDRLHLVTQAGSSVRIDESVLREGYTTTEVSGFVGEFRRNLARLQRIHSLICGEGTSESGLREFFRLSRQACKLTLARYLFTPDEVVGWILGELRISGGVRDFPAALVRDEMKRTLYRLPEFEAQIIEGLCRSSRIYWVADATSAELNSLVEYPIDTIVVVVKPPGSTLELEIKRCGSRGERPVDIAFQEGGRRARIEHRLVGVSMDNLQKWEVETSARFSRLYRSIHGEEPPISQAVSMVTVNTVPTRHGEAHLLDYFTDPRVFGDGYPAMRTEMRACVEAFREDRPRTLLKDLPGALGLTVEFLSYASPTQAILCDTSSFRLDLIAAYLSERGPALYFQEGLGIATTRVDEKQLADTVLEEILGVYAPPSKELADYGDYVQEAFALPVNRRRADRVYGSLMWQIGMFWGTLLGVRGCSFGESFVARNVGIKTGWVDGDWRVRIIFMDHDALSMPVHRQPRALLRGMTLDATYILGEYPYGSAPLLAAIYRVSEDVTQRGRMLLRQAMAESYRQAQDKVIKKPEIRELFSETFIARLRDWDILVGSYLEAADDRSGIAAWREKSRGFLEAKEYEKPLIEEYLEVIEENSQFFVDFVFLFSHGSSPDASANGMGCILCV